MGRRGLTLVELLVGMFIALFLTAAAVTFATNETRLLGDSNDQMDLEKSGRAAIDLLAQDLRMAGAGIGYGQNGEFLGIQTATFETPGGARFNAGGTTQTIRLAGFRAETQDLLILAAAGTYASIADWTGAGGEYCGGPEAIFRTPDQVLLRDASGLALVTGKLVPGGAVSCRRARCPGACVAFAFSANPGADYVTFASDPQASSAQFGGGEVMGFEAIAWFVANQPAPHDYAGQISRVRFNGANRCASREACGHANALAGFVEAMAYQVWEYNAAANPPEWQTLDRSKAIVPKSPEDRLRVDVELVVRSHIIDDRPHEPAVLRLDPHPPAGCFAGKCPPSGGTCLPGGGRAENASDPATCPGGRGAWDNVSRRVFRASVELKNSGRGAAR